MGFVYYVKMWQMYPVLFDHTILFRYIYLIILIVSLK